MKTLAIFTAVVITAVALFAADGQPPMPTGSQVGRFQLCQGTKPMLNHGQQIETLFRIDTVTGQTWEISPTPFNTNGSVAVVHVWQPVNEEGSGLHKAAMDSLQPVVPAVR